jgi:SAM-dependent methyltransferase
MKGHHLKSEQEFYLRAYSDNETRRDRKCSWGYLPSRTIFEVLESNIPDLSTLRALDIGCGDGRHTEYLLSKGCRQVTAIDFSHAALALCEERFRGDTRVETVMIDLTVRDALSGLGQFGLLIDWSVLDHQRREYLVSYLRNIVGALQPGGYLFSSEFDENLPGIWKNRDYKVVCGHYSRGYTSEGLVRLFPGLMLVDSRESVLEDEINNYRLHTVLLKKVGTVCPRHSKSF